MFEEEKGRSQFQNEFVGYLVRDIQGVVKEEYEVLGGSWGQREGFENFIYYKWQLKW